MDHIIDRNDLRAAWPPGQEDLWQAFAALTAEAESLPLARWTLMSREGVSYSYRAAIGDSSRPRPVFFLVDVVVSDRDPWFLSVCFYEDEVSDPREEGNAIPQGLFGETGYCFDVETYDSEVLIYLKERIHEAYRNAGRSGGEANP